MPVYQYYLADAYTGALIGELPFTPTDRYTRLLSGAGAFSGTIPLDHPMASRANFKDRVPNLIVVRANTVKWFGPVVSPVPDLAGRKLQITAREPTWWMQKRCIEENKHYKADTHVIFRKMWTYVTSKTDAGGINAALPNIVVGSGNSGTTKKIPIAGSGRYLMADLVHDMLVDDDAGLEYRVDYSGTIAEPLATITLGSPLGTTRNHLMTEHTVNGYGLSLDFDQAVTRAHVVGAIKAATRQNHGSVTDGYPLLDGVLDRSDISDIDTLGRIAREFRRKARPPIRVFDVEFNPTPGGLTFGFANLGDSVRFAPKSPDLLTANGTRRVVEIAVMPDTETETELIGLNFNLPLEDLGA